MKQLQVNKLPLILILAILVFVCLGGLFFRKEGNNKSIPKSENEEAIPTNSNFSERAGEVSLNLLSSQSNLRVGEDLKVDVSIKADKEIVGADLEINYNPDTLSFDNFKMGGFFVSPQEIRKEIDDKNGTIFYSLGSFAAAKGEGTLVTLIFKTKNEGQGEIGFGDKNSVAALDGASLHLTLSPALLYFTYK